LIGRAGFAARGLCSCDRRAAGAAGGIRQWCGAPDKQSALEAISQLPLGNGPARSGGGRLLPTPAGALVSVLTPERLGHDAICLGRPRWVCCRRRVVYGGWHWRAAKFALTWERRQAPGCIYLAGRDRTVRRTPPLCDYDRRDPGLASRQSSSPEPQWASFFSKTLAWVPPCVPRYDGGGSNAGAHGTGGLGGVVFALIGIFLIFRPSPTRDAGRAVGLGVASRRSPSNPSVRFCLRRGGGGPL